MIMNMNEKGRQTKLLAAIAVLAMVVCALAVVMPSEEVQGVETNVAPNSADKEDFLQAAIDAAQPYDTLVLSAGDYYNYVNVENGTYTVYQIDKPLTIKAAEDAEVNIYGGFAIFDLNGTKAVPVDEVTLQGLNIFVQGDNDQTLNRSGTTLLGKQVSITGCTYTLNENGELANAITIFPLGTADAKIDITGNTFVGFDSSTGTTQTWSASGITVAENYPMNGRFGSDSFTTTTLGLTPAQEDSLVDDNDYQNCANVYDRTDYTDYDYDTTVPETNYTQDGGIITQNNFSVAAGITYTITGEESYTNVSVQGTLIVNGTLNADTITVGKSGKLSVGTNGTVSATNTITSAAANLDAISAVSFYSGTATATNGPVVLKGTLQGFTGSTVFMYTDDYSGDFNFNYAEGTTEYTLNVGAVDSFNGTVGIVSGSVTVAQISVTFEGGENVTANSIKFTYSNSSWTVDVIGTVVDQYTVDVNGEEADGEVEVDRQYSATVTGIVLADLNSSSDDETYATVNLNNVMLGTMTLVNKINANGVTVGNGDTLTLDEGAGITVGTSNMFVLGSLRTPITGTEARQMIDNSGSNGVVYTMNYGETRHFVKSIDGADIIAINGGTITIDLNSTSDAEAQAILASADAGQTVVITNSNANTDTLVITGTLDLNGITITIPEGKNITIQIGNGTQTANRASVSMTGVTFNSNGTDSEIQVQAGSALDITDSLLFVVVDAADGSTVNVDNDDVVYQNTSSQVSVGYGTTLTLTGNVTSVVDVYGTLVIESTATVPAGTEMTVYKGGNVVVNGTLTILGTATFETGSDAEINGTVTVGQYSAGGAALNVAGDFTIAEAGNVTITGVAADNVNKNELNAPVSVYTADEDVVSGYSYPYMFEVYGTLTMNGTMSGYIHDHGTVTISGVSENATIVLYSDVAFTVTSVDGKLNVTDEGVLDDMLRTGQIVSDGNIVNLTDVRNVSVSVSYDRYDYSISGTNYRNYRTVMAVSGEVTTGTGMEGTVELAGTPAEVQTDKDGSTAAAYITVIDETTLSFGVNVNFTVNADLTVDGDVVFVKATGNGVTDDKAITGNGSILVNGLMTTSNNAVPTGISVTAVKYTISTTGANATITDYYTNFADAVTAAPDADRDTITVMGTVKVSADVTIPAGVIVQIENNGAINVVEDVTLVLSDGATMNGSSTTKVIVDGTFTAQDYAEDLGVRTIEADVMSTEGASRTWTSLANAIESGMTDITLNRAVTIDSDLTIPEGVTVTTNVAPVTEGGNTYAILVDDATLTVNGTLAMLETSEGAISVIGEDGEIIVNGVYYARIMSADAPETMDNVAGAHFAVGSGASTYYYVSNVEFAAQTTTENDNLEGAIVIKGIVAAGDVTFTAADGVPMKIELQPLTVNSTVGSPENMTILTAGTVTLAGEVTFDINDNTRMTGIIAGLCGDGTATASVEFSSVEDDLVITESSTEGATSTTYKLTVSGSYGGDLTVAAGIVTVDGLTVQNNATMTVAEGATLEIPEGETLAVYDGSDVDTPVVIDGTVTVADVNGISGTGLVTVNGQMTASKGLNLTTNTVRVTGTLTIADEETLAINGGKLIVGDKPATLGTQATGSVVGTIAFNPSGSGYILAYTGVDMTGAMMDINAATGESDAASTVYYINEVEYATIYAYGTSTLPVITINGADGDIELTGYDTNDRWYETAEEAVAGQDGAFNASDRISSYDAAYAQFVVSDVPGTISQGTGLTIYIDGLTIDTYGNNYYVYLLSVGTHTVTITANANYSIDNATITFNGQTVQNGGTITINAGDVSFTLAASGATPADTSVVIEGGSSDDGLGLTDYLLIILVVLIVIMAIIVALRLMRS